MGTKNIDKKFSQHTQRCFTVLSLNITGVLQPANPTQVTYSTVIIQLGDSRCRTYPLPNPPPPTKAHLGVSRKCFFSSYYNICKVLLTYVCIRMNEISRLQSYGPQYTVNCFSVHTRSFDPYLYLLMFPFIKSRHMSFYQFSSIDLYICKNII